MVVTENLGTWVIVSSTVDLVGLLEVEEVLMSIIVHFCGINTGTFCSSARSCTKISSSCDM